MDTDKQFLWQIRVAWQLTGKKISWKWKTCLYLETVISKAVFNNYKLCWAEQVNRNQTTLQRSCKATQLQIQPILLGALDPWTTWPTFAG